jgi:AraC-like DNA-binding protein
LPHNPFHAQPAFSGTSFEDLLATFRPYFPPFRASLLNPRQNFRWKSDVVIGPGLGMLRRNRYAADWSIGSQTSDEILHVILPIAGVAEGMIGTKAVVAPPLTALLTPAPLWRHIGMYCVGGEYASVTLMLEAEVVSRVLSAMFDGATLSKLDLAPLLDLSSGAGATFHLLAQTIASGMHGARLLERSPKAMALLTEAALQLIFEHVPHRLSYRLDRELLEVAPRHTHRAIDFMRANMHRPLTVMDIAEAVGVSVRSLQVGFRQFKRTTPAAYLRLIRLQTAHAELSSPENRLLVSEVALKWGFTQMGRFAAQYRAMFGVYPSETARRAQGED